MSNVIKAPSQEVIKKLDGSALEVIGSQALAGFEKAYKVADAIVQLKQLLTDEYMAPIMALQGNKLGFKTDKDKEGGYKLPDVKNCLIEAVLIGLEPTGNQFNIIASSMYPTKEGCGALLNKHKGLRKWDVIPGLPRINAERTSAAVDVKIKWTLADGTQKEETIPLAIKMDPKYTSVDAIAGKATRKGRAWLLSSISGVEITDGDTNDIDYKEEAVRKDPERDRLLQLIANATTLKKLDELEPEIKDDDVRAAWNTKKNEILDKE